MDNVTLEWEKVEDSIKKLDDTEFYAFTQNNTLLYIGIAYFQDVADEIRKTIKAFNYNEDEIKIWLGYIVESDYKKRCQIYLLSYSRLRLTRSGVFVFISFLLNRYDII